MKNKLNPNDRVIIEQLFESIKVYIRQFKKTPNLQIARLIKVACIKLANTMNKYIDCEEKQNSKKIKINKRSVQ